MSANCSHEFSSSGAGNMCDDTKLNMTKRGSLETDAVVLNDDDKSLCCKLNQVKIVQQIQDKPSKAQSEEQNCESGTNNTPDLLQHGISEGEHGASCHDGNDRYANQDNAAGGAEGSGNASKLTQYEIQAKVQATPFDDDYSQTATAAPKASPPPTTKPRVNAATFQHRARSRTPQVQVPPTPSPIQESTSQASLSQAPLKSTPKEPPEEDEEHYDVLLLYSKLDKREAKWFFVIAEKANWKVATSDDFLPSQTKIKSFEDVHKNSSYTVLLLTSNFIVDVWCEYQYEAALTESIENPAKRYTVVPIICQDQGLELPLALRTFTGVKLTNPCFAKILQKTIKVERRLKREKAGREKQA